MRGSSAMRFAFSLRRCPPSGLMAQGFCPFAHGCAQVHQALRIGGHIGVFRRQQAFGKCPERVFEFFVLRIAVAGEHAAEHAFDVAVQNGFAAVEGKGAMAAAVLLPTPQRVSKSLRSDGNVPPNCSTTCCAALCRLRARL